LKGGKGPKTQKLEGIKKKMSVRKTSLLTRKSTGTGVSARAVCPQREGHEGENNKKRKSISTSPKKAGNRNNFNIKGSKKENPLP